MRSGRSHGTGEKKYSYRFLSGNCRLDELQAAVLRVKLRHVETMNARRVEAAERYRMLFGHSGLLDGGQVALLERQEGSSHVYHQFVLKADRRDELASYLAARDIGTARPGGIPLFSFTSRA